jgi:hypothetical protein
MFDRKELTMLYKKYDFFLPVTLTVVQFDEIQDKIRALKELYSINHVDELTTSEILYEALDFYYETVFNIGRREPAPFLDNIETP